MKRTQIFVLLISLLLSACAPAPPSTATALPAAIHTATPTATATAISTPAPTAVPQVTPTATPIPAAHPRTDTPAPIPNQKGYALEFTHQVSSDMATLHVLAHTCSGIRGPWEGTFDVELAAEEMQIGGSGSITFTLPPNGFTARGEAPYSGGGTFNTACVITNVSGPLRFEITFSPDGSTADVIMGSTGPETLTAVCTDGEEYFTWTQPFLIAWGPEPLTVPVTHFDDCP